MNFKNLFTIALLPAAAFSLEIRLKNRTVTSKKFDQIKQARTITLEMQKALFKKNGFDFSAYEKDLKNKLKSNEESVLKDFLYSKAIQDRAKEAETASVQSKIYGLLQPNSKSRAKNFKKIHGRRK